MSLKASQDTFDNYEWSTMNMIASLQAHGINHYMKKNIPGLNTILRTIYFTYKKEFGPKDLPDEFTEHLELLNKKVYSDNFQDPHYKSKAFDDAEKLWTQMSACLITSGLARRTKVDPGALVAN